MSIKTRLIFGILLILSLQSCLVLSFFPFYTDGQKVDLRTELDGKWKVKMLQGEKATSVRDWEFTGEFLTMYDEKSHQGRMKVTFFEAGGMLFADTFPRDQRDVQGALYYRMHLYPYHSVVKVLKEKDRLTLIPLDVEWFTKQVMNGTIDVPYLREPNSDDFLLFSARPETWTTVLEKYGSSTNAFPPDYLFILVRD